MPVLNISKQAQQLYPQGGRVLVANTDIVNPVYVSTGRQPNRQDSQVPPLGSVELDGGWFVSTLDAKITVVLHTFPDGSSWTPSPYLTALQNQLLGVPAFVPNLASKSLEQQGPVSPAPIVYTFLADGKIWGAHVDLNIASSGAYAAGTTSAAYARIRSGTTTLAITGVAIGNSADQDSGGSDRDIPGLLAPAGTNITLDVNNGTTVANAVITANCTVLYSIP